MIAPTAGDTAPGIARYAIRRSEWQKTTTGLARGYAQVNLVIIPEAYAFDFLRFCMANRAACPLLDVSEPGSPHPQALGDDIDLRTDVPRYRVYENGELVDEPSDLHARWRDDLVTFSIGCSYSFEEALAAEGVPVRHMEAQCIVPMYRTNLPLIPAGPFDGSYVVSMRAMPPADAIRAIQLTTDMPSVHGAPLHLANPELIGIRDIHQPDFGDKPIMHTNDIPVFWACGVTPQVALMNAKLPFAMAHAPGYMLITDIPNHRLKYR